MNAKPQVLYPATKLRSKVDKVFQCNHPGHTGSKREPVEYNPEKTGTSCATRLVVSIRIDWDESGTQFGQRVATE